MVLFKTWQLFDLFNIGKKGKENEFKNILQGKRLRKFCNQRQCHFIRHDDIHSTDLNRGGLHLGETGIAKMYNNFANKLDECN